MEIQKRSYTNNKLNINLNCYIDKDNQIWFRGKEIALLLDYKNPLRAVRNYVHEDDKKLIDFKIKLNSSMTKIVTEAESREITRKCFFINESGFYSLILSSKQPKAKEFKHWVTSKVLPSIRKYGYYNPKNNKIMIETENDLHYQVVDFVKEKYPDSLLIAGLGENQRTENTR